MSTTTAVADNIVWHVPSLDETPPPLVFVEADGKVTRIPSVIELGSRPTKNGAPVALMTDADAFERRVLLPDSEIAVHVERPAGLSAPVRATATLRAQAVRPEILDALLLGARASEVPTHVLAEAGVDL